jgi:glycosyl transferase family 25
MERQLARTNLDYEFVQAVDGAALTAAARAALVDEQAVARFPWWLTPAAIGCILSHKAVYQRVAGDDAGPALVLEDDGRLPPDLAAITAALAQHVAPDEVMLLNFRSFRPCELRRTGGVTAAEYRLLPPAVPRQVLSALAYLVGQRAAERMDALITPVRWTADSWSEYLEHGAIGTLRCVVPRPIVSDIALTSTIRDGWLSPVSSLTPVKLLRRANRHRVARRMGRIQIVD